MSKENLKRLIQQREVELQECQSSEGRSNILADLIALKHRLNSDESLYPYVKRFTTEYLKSKNTADVQYESPNQDALKRRLDVLDPKDAFKVVKYAIRYSTLNCYIDTEVLESVRRAYQFQYYRSLASKNPIYVMRLALLFFSSSVPRMLLLSFVIYVCCYLLLLPAPIDSMEIVHMEKENYSDLFWVNHAINVLSVFAGFSPAKILAINSLGVLMLSIFKLFLVYIFIDLIYIGIKNKLEL